MNRARVEQSRNEWLREKSSESFHGYALDAASYLESQEFKNSQLHWFCSDAVTSDHAMSSLIVLSYEPDNAEIGELYREFKKSLTDALSKCSKCAIAYQKNQVKLWSCLSDDLKLPRDAVHDFFLRVHSFDRSRLSEEIKAVDANPDYDRLTIALTEIFYSPGCLGKGGLLNALNLIAPQVLKHEEIVSALPDLAPGYLALLFSSNDSLHDFAMKKLTANKARLSQEWYDSYLHTFSHCLSRNCGASATCDASWYIAGCLISWLSSDIERQHTDRGHNDHTHKHSEVLDSVLNITAGRVIQMNVREEPPVSYLGMHSLLLTVLTTFRKECCTVISVEIVAAIARYACRSLPGDQDFRAMVENSATYAIDHAQLSMETLATWIPLLIQVLPRLQIESESGRYKRRPSLDPLGPNLKVQLQLDVLCFTLKLADRSFGPSLEHQDKKWSRFYLSTETAKRLALLAFTELQSSQELLSYGGYKYISDHSNLLASILPNTQEFGEAVAKLTSRGVEKSMQSNSSDDLKFSFRLQERQDIAESPHLVCGLLTGYQSVAYWPWDHSKHRDPQASKSDFSPTHMVCDLLSAISGSSASTHELRKPETYRSLVNLSTSSDQAIQYAALTVINDKLGEEEAVFIADDVFMDSDETSGNDTYWGPQSGIAGMLKWDPVLVIQIAIDDFTVAISDQKDQERKIPSFPGLIRYCRNVLSAIFDSRAGITPEMRQKLNKDQLLLQFWEKSWAFIRLIVGNVRSWAKNFTQSAIKDLIYVTLDYCLQLLDNFRLIESQLPNDESQNKWGAALALPAAACVPDMRSLFFLAFEDMLTKAHLVFINLITLMRSFKVAIPAETLDQFKLLASGKSNSKLNKQQIQELLEVTGEYTLPEISRIMDSRPLRASDSSEKQSTPSSSEHSDNHQKKLLHWFQTTTTQPRASSPDVSSAGIPLSTPPVSSQMEQIRARMSQKNSTSTHTTTKNGGSALAYRASELHNRVKIHPARPAGFNEKRQPNSTSKAQHQAASDTDHESDEDHEDREEGALNILRRKTQHLEVLSKLPTTKLHPPPKASSNDQEVEQRRMRARLTVDPSGLHRVILSWQWREKSPYPTNFDMEKRKVPNKFETIEEYCGVMEPLLHLEAWQQIMRAKDESEAPFLVSIGRRVLCDDFTDVYVSVAAGAWSKGEASEGDLLVMAVDPTNPKPEQPQSAKLNGSLITALARIKDGTVRNRAGNVDMELRLYDPRPLLPYLHQGMLFSAMRVCSLTTVEREYCSLQALKYYDLKSEILDARPANLTSQVLSANRSDLDRLQSNLGLNESQAKAVRQAVTAQGFSLIQGPPGTGKTKTILGIIGAYFSNGTNSRRILVCAPSNAAVDEIVLRLKQGVVNADGKKLNLKIVRLGRPEAVNQQVREFALEELVAKNISNQAIVVDGKLRQAHTDLVRKRNDLRAKLQRRQANPEKTDDDLPPDAATELRKLNGLIHEKGLELDIQRENLERAKRQRDLDYRKAQQQILNDCQVVCSTLSGAAYSLLSNIELYFPTVIIDEAAQCVELSALIPLKYGCKQCVMVGDPNQLPPTVISQEAAKLKYDQSLFVRMFKQHSRESVCMLDTQFRMHPEISKFPSREFYEGKLLTAPDMEKKTYREWHVDRVFRPFAFFNIAGKQVRSAQRSLSNATEAEAAASLVKKLLEKFESVYDFSGKIGVISPYKEQVRLMRQTFIRCFGHDITHIIDFNTVDGFQGQEKDIIILSCVRAAQDVDGVGFLGDTRRMNVAITRARSSLWVVGNINSLEKSPVWKRLIGYAKEMDSLYEVENARNSYSSALSSVKDIKKPVNGSSGQPKQTKERLMELPPNKSAHQNYTTIDATENRNRQNPSDSSESEEIETASKLSNQGDDSPPKIMPTAKNDLEARIQVDNEDKIKTASSHPPAKKMKRPPSLFLPSKKKGRFVPQPRNP